MTGLLFALFALFNGISHAWVRTSCRAMPSVVTESGQICGLERLAGDGSSYASFRGVPYAKQPLGELRFKELEPAEPWGILFATNEGPICLQTDVVYGKIMQPRGKSEACIYANIHVPMEALPNAGRRLARQLDSYPEEVTSSGLPILVFIHGGGFAYGSGDTDLHGPEYLVSKKIIVITFNYRLNVFGFLSLNTTQVPGNAGLRDMVTLLRWVQKNAKNFGGDPNDVTIAGQSAGAVAAHLLALSPVASKGLFKRAILMSGAATSGFYTPSPFYSQFISTQLLTILGITSTDPDDIHRQLIELPAEKLSDANAILLDNLGLTTFMPVVESALPGVLPIIDDYPEILMAKGRGNDIPLLIGYTSNECETFRDRLEKIDIVKKIKEGPQLIVPPKTIFTTPPDQLLDLAKKIDREYYNGTINVDNFVKSCSDGLYEYAALKLAEQRVTADSAPAYLYRFAYEGQSNLVKEGTGGKYQGVGHIEDLTYVFKVNSLIGTSELTMPTQNDICMKNLMTDIFTNFMICSKPICFDSNSTWPALSRREFEDIESPSMVQIKEYSPRQHRLVSFFDNLANPNAVK